MATTESSYNCFEYCGHFHILENLGESLGRVFTAIWSVWLSALCHCNQSSLATQLSVETHPSNSLLNQNLIAQMQWLTSGDWDCFLNNSQQLAMGQTNNKKKNSRDKEQITQSFKSSILRRCFPSQEAILA